MPTEPKPTGAFEVRRFKTHPKLLMDVIRRQAGTLGKAILEGVQNSIDARASAVDITLERGLVVIADDGKGFPNREEIEQFFEVFGQPHEVGERKVFGNFRMGRGQQFAFGRNLWRSGEFSMTVDIESLGLDYQLCAGLPPAPGCRIEIALYERLDVVQLYDLEREIGKLVKFAEIPVRVNGQQLNKPASTHKWGHATDEAWFKINPGGEGGIDVFNLGVHVCHLSSWEYGCSGVIVSRKQVRVNFARNDIMGTCPVWRKVLVTLRELSGKKKAVPGRLTASQRATFWREIVAGGGDLTNYRDHRLFVDSNGDVRSLRQIERARWRLEHEAGSRKARLCLSVNGVALADRVMQARLAIVLDEIMLELTGCQSGEELLDLLIWKNSCGTKERLSDLFCFAELAMVAKPLADRGHSIVPDEQLSDTERIGLSVVETIGDLVADAVVTQELGVMPEWGSPDRAVYQTKAGTFTRRIRAGESDHADGWTDGATYVAIRRDILRDAGTEASFTDMTLLLMHEYCHRSDSIGDHTHDFDFYRVYHELTRKAGRLSAVARICYDRALMSAGKRVARQRKQEARRQRLDDARAELGLIPSDGGAPGGS